MGEGEPLWLEDDRAWAIALLQVEAETCRGCGHPLSETTAYVKKNGRKFPAHSYKASRLVCMACDAIALAAKDSNSDRPSADHWRATRV